MSTIVRGHIGRYSPGLVRPRPAGAVIALPVYLFSDNFNRADGNPNDPPDHPWTTGGSPVISGNKLFAPAGNLAFYRYGYTTYLDLEGIYPLQVSAEIYHNNDFIHNWVEIARWDIGINREGANWARAILYYETLNDRWKLGLDLEGPQYWTGWTAGVPSSGERLYFDYRAVDGQPGVFRYRARFAEVTLTEDETIVSGSPLYAYFAVQSPSVNRCPTGVYIDNFIVEEIE